MFKGFIKEHQLEFLVNQKQSARVVTCIYYSAAIASNFFFHEFCDEIQVLLMKS